MKCFVVVEDWSGAHIHFEGTYKECLSMLEGIYNEMVEFRAFMPMEECPPILYIEGDNTLIIAGNNLEKYTIYMGPNAEELLQLLANDRKYHS